MQCTPQWLLAYRASNAEAGGGANKLAPSPEAVKCSSLSRRSSGEGEALRRLRVLSIICRASSLDVSKWSALSRRSGVEGEALRCLSDGSSNCRYT